MAVKGGHIDNIFLAPLPPHLAAGSANGFLNPATTEGTKRGIESGINENLVHAISMFNLRFKSVRASCINLQFDLKHLFLKKN